MIKISIILLSFLMAPMALADVGLCLEEATNAQLLKELRFRLNTPGVGNDYALPTVSCYGSTMTIALVDLDGNEAKDSLNTVSTLECSSQATQITNKLGGKVMSSTIVGACYGSTLQRRMLKADGSIKALSDMNFVSSLECKKKVKEINAQ